MTETTFKVSAILFDMDGTLIDSTAGVIGAWEHLARLHPGLHVEEILRTSHGVRTIDNLRKWCPDIPEEGLQNAVEDFELEIVRSSKRNQDAGKDGIVVLPGVREIMDKLGETGWAICTSAATAYATAALQIAGITMPHAFVSADDVSRGKPFPDPYLLGAAKCGADPATCLVIEDAPTGVASGKAAGSKVMAVLTSHSRDRMAETMPDYLVEDLTQVSISPVPGGFEVSIRHP